MWYMVAYRVNQLRNKPTATLVDLRTRFWSMVLQLLYRYATIKAEICRYCLIQCLIKIQCV